jgi:hypothetical protein
MRVFNKMGIHDACIYLNDTPIRFYTAVGKVHFGEELGVFMCFAVQIVGYQETEIGDLRLG